MAPYPSVVSMNLNKKSSIIISFATFTLSMLFQQFATAEMLSLKAEAKKLKVLTLYSSSKDVEAKWPALAHYKQAAIERDHKLCHQRYEKAWRAGKLVRGWIALNYLQCFDGQASLQAGDFVKKLKEWNAESLFRQGPWSAELKNKSVQLAMDVLNKETDESLIHWLFQQNDLLTPGQKAFLQAVRGQQALRKKQFEEALFRFESARKVDPRLVGIKDYNEALKGMKLQPPVATPPVSPSSVAKAAVADSLEIRIQKEPAGKNLAEWRKEFLDAYDKAEKTGKTSEFIGGLSSVPSIFLIDWAENLHRRLDYSNALKLCQVVMARGLGAPEDSEVLWLAGRSSQFLGQYEKALEYFAELGARWGATKEGQEGFFRSGLVLYRLQKWSEAQAVFAQIRKSDSDRFDLLARYWEIRSLQKKGDSVDSLMRELVAKYPWSYYGLRIQSELNRGLWKLPEFEVVKQPDLDKIWLEGEDFAIFKRIEFLLQNGMQEEAHYEARLLASLPRASQMKALSEFFQKGALWLPAIIQMNAAQEAEKAYLSWSVTKEVFPRPYPQEYESEAKVYSLPVELLWSLTRQESGFNTRATSTSNAMGLMQLIPPTAKDVAAKLKLKLNLPQDAYRPSVNIKMGSSYIAEVIGQFGGSIPLGLAGYNAGPHKVKRWLDQRPVTQVLPGLKNSDPDIEIWFDELPWSETSFYVKAILRNLSIYRLIKYEADAGPGANKLQSGVDLGPVWW